MRFGMGGYAREQVQTHGGAVVGQDLLADAVLAEELGFDSLFMTQLASTYRQTFGIELTFRQLIDEYPSLGALADYIAREIPKWSKVVNGWSEEGGPCFSAPTLQGSTTKAA